MTDQALVQVSRQSGQVAVVTLDRQAKLNAMNSELTAAFVDVMDELSADEDLRAVVLTGAGERAFVGGADIDEMSALRTPDEGRSFILRVHRCCAAVRACPVPVIGRINGFALGAGMELAASCDIRIAVDTARFGMPEVRLGIPSVVEAALLPRLVGWGRAREILLLGETFSAEQALTWGLVETVAPRGNLDSVIEARLASLLSATPRAIRIQKALIRRWEELPLSEAVTAGVEAFAEAFETDEPVRAFADYQTARAARNKL